MLVVEWGGGQTTGWLLAETDRQMGRITSREMDLNVRKGLSNSQEKDSVVVLQLTRTMMPIMVLIYTAH